MVKKQTPLDKKGYYRLLKVSPETSADEIRLAFAMAKQNAAGPHLQKMEEAYEVLKDKESRAAYDAEGQGQRASYLRNPLTLVACIVVLAASIALLWLPDLRLRQKSFQTGQELVTIGTRAPFGEVVRYNPRHEFANGTSGPAYLVRLAETGAERWFPAIDLQATCEGS
jgi:curved DNA-binding protein CbpA